MSISVRMSPARRLTPRLVKWLPALVVLVVLLVLPRLDLTVPVVLPGAFASPGTLQVMAVALVFAGLAVSYDIVFGYAGLVSFGHAIFFGLGIYGTNLMLRAGHGLVLSALVAVLVATLAALVVGLVALRLSGIAFSMVTLAFVQVLTVLLVTDPLDVTGGEEGFPLASEHVPTAFLRVIDTANLYWLALGFLVLAFAVGWLVTRSSAGLVWEAIRENERRVEMLGFHPYPSKLLAFTIGGALAGLGGVAYLLITKGSNPSSASIDFSLALLLMVILGGAGRLWGAAIGGAAYGIITLRLPALPTSGVLDGLPHVVARVLAEPLFVLGLVFVVVVLVLPSGVAGGVETLRRALARRRG